MDKVFIVHLAKLKRKVNGLRVKELNGLNDNNQFELKNI